MVKNLVMAFIGLCVLAGCSNQQSFLVGTKKTGKIIHVVFAKSAGATPVTAVYDESMQKRGPKLVGLFTGEDLATAVLKGLSAAPAAAVNGMFFGMFRRPDKYEDNSSVNAEGGGGDGGGGGDSSSSSSSDQSQSQSQTQSQKASASAKATSSASSSSKSSSKSRPRIVGPKKPVCKPKPAPKHKNKKGKGHKKGKHGSKDD